MKAREEIRSNDVDDVERVRFGHAILRRLRRIFNLPLFSLKNLRELVYGRVSGVLGVIWLLYDVF